MSTKFHPVVGKRVEIPAYADLWMRGARFGVVERVDCREEGDVWKVRMDHPQVSGKLYGFKADDCQVIGDAQRSER